MLNISNKNNINKIKIFINEYAKTYYFLCILKKQKKFIII